MDTESFGLTMEITSKEHFKMTRLKGKESSQKMMAWCMKETLKMISSTEKE